MHSAPNIGERGFAFADIRKVAGKRFVRFIFFSERCACPAVRDDKRVAVFPRIGKRAIEFDRFFIAFRLYEEGCVFFGDGDVRVKSCSPGSALIMRKRSGNIVFEKRKLREISLRPRGAARFFGIEPTRCGTFFIAVFHFHNAQVIECIPRGHLFRSGYVCFEQFLPFSPCHKLTRTVFGGAIRKASFRKQKPPWVLLVRKTKRRRRRYIAFAPHHPPLFFERAPFSRIGKRF